VYGTFQSGEMVCLEQQASDWINADGNAACSLDSVW
jgi:hypothetical protein